MKYATTVLTILACVGGGWVMGSVLRPLPGVAPAAPVSTALNQQLKSSDEEMLRLRKFQQTLALISQLSASSPAPVLQRVRASQPAVARAGRVAKPDISMVYVSSDLQKIALNGRLLGPGDRLPSGGRLVAIAQDRIVIERQGRRSVVRLPAPQVLGGR